MPFSTLNRRSAGALAAAALALLFACAAPDSEEQDRNWTEAADLIATSDRIVLAQFVESRQETVQLVDSDSGALAGETEILFRQFEISETVKGTTDPGDLLWVAFDAGRGGELVNREGDVRDFGGSNTYVLFLKGRLRPLEYPPEFGSVLWTGNGEPAFAELVGNGLEFRAERQYLDLLRQEERNLPDRLSAAPFTLTLDELREDAG